MDSNKGQVAAPFTGFVTQKENFIPLDSTAFE